jgi:hypothetical protein
MVALDQLRSFDSTGFTLQTKPTIRVLADNHVPIGKARFAPNKVRITQVAEDKVTSGMHVLTVKGAEAHTMMFQLHGAHKKTHVAPFFVIKSASGDDDVNVKISRTTMTVPFTQDNKKREANGSIPGMKKHKKIDEGEEVIVFKDRTKNGKRATTVLLGSAAKKQNVQPKNA